jgi:antitoxin (DNA-binding transcriptional repressor) of toxin-antitoxin stability system
MAAYVVTLRGEPVAVMRPIAEQDTQWLREVEVRQLLAAMKDLAQDVAGTWISEKNGKEQTHVVQPAHEVAIAFPPARLDK